MLEMATTKDPESVVSWVISGEFCCKNVCTYVCVYIYMCFLDGLNMLHLKSVIVFL